LTEVVLQVPYNICTKVQTENHLWETKGGDWEILRELCSWKQVNIIEAEICPDHVHMLVEIPPKISVSNFVGFLKGKSTLLIFERHANLKYKYGNRTFWCRGYYVDTVGKNKEKIAEYIRNQLQEDQVYDQISMKEYMDPFKG
jgi:putative transposase